MNRALSLFALGLWTLAPTPLLAQDAADALRGREVTDQRAIEDAAALARDAATPISDARGTVEQRKHLAGVLTQRALNIAIQRALEA